MERTKLLGGLLVLLTGISFCSAQISSGTILEVLSRTNGLKTFGSWCQETFPGLYSGSGVLTVFAFNDTAYNYNTPSAVRTKLRSMTLDEKREYVQTYTLESKISVDQMRDASTQQAINGKDLFINKRNRVYWNPGSTTGSTVTYVNGAMIIREQLQASNGIIHVLDRPLNLVSDKNVYQWLMDPDDPTVPTTTIVQLAERLYGEYFTSVISPIGTNERVTFFLPSENALRKIPNSKLMSLNGLELSNTREIIRTWKDLAAKLYQDSRYYLDVVTPVARQDKVTFFIPSENALRKIPASKIQGLQGEELANYFKMHYVLNRVVYTSYVEHQESYETAYTGSRVMFMRQDANRVLVKSGGVTAMVERGNITVRNGVIHIIDRMFGFVYNSAREQISNDAPTFNRLIDRVSPELQQLINQPSGVNLFVPTEDAFTYIQNLRGVNFDTNSSLVDFIVRLSLVRDGSVEVSQINGNYDVRQRRYTRFGNWKLVVYNDRNESWVNGGNVRARIIRPDIKVTTGVLQYIDAVLGVPSMDIPTQIYYDDYLIYTYNDLKMTGLDTYLKDQSFDSSYLPPRSFDQYGNGMNNFGQQNNYGMFTTSRPNEYPTEYPGQQTSYPNNLPEYEYQRRLQAQQSGQNQNYGNNQYGNQNYGNNQYGNQNSGNNQYGNQNSGNNQYGNNQYGNQNNGNNQYGNQNYGNNQYGNQNRNQNSGSSYYGTCGSSYNVCQFTVFVPNGTAIYNYYMTSLGNTITRDIPRYRYVLRRHVIPNQLIFIEQLPVSSQSYRYRAHNGDEIVLRKESENAVRISWSGMSARIIMSDLGATNGVVHIIDTVLSQLSDRDVDVSASTVLSGNFCVFGSIAVTLCLLLGLRR